MKTKIVGVLRTFACMLIIIVAFWFLCKPVFYRLYPWDRIKGNLQVTLNGTPVSLDENNFKVSSFASSPASDDEYSIKGDGDNTDISIKGGAYGNYTLGINVPGFAETIKMEAYQASWWNVTTFNMDIDIDTKTNCVLYTYDYTYIGDNGKKYSESRSVSNIIGKDDLKVFFGL